MGRRREAQVLQWHYRRRLCRRLLRWATVGGAVLACRWLQPSGGDRAVFSAGSAGGGFRASCRGAAGKHRCSCGTPRQTWAGRRQRCLTPVSTVGSYGGGRSEVQFSLACGSSLAVPAWVGPMIDGQAQLARARQEAASGPLRLIAWGRCGFVVSFVGAPRLGLLGRPPDPVLAHGTDWGFRRGCGSRCVSQRGITPGQRPAPGMATTSGIGPSGNDIEAWFGGEW
jgi:hypothetical protein